MHNCHHGDAVVLLAQLKWMAVNFSEGIGKEGEVME